MNRSFTKAELEKYNGQEGNPGYVAVDGKVYDVSKSALWKNGTHMGRHAAGNDLTADLEAAPHGDEVLGGADVKEVGTFTAEVDAHLPPLVRKTLELIPSARRHLHPITVHFPTAYFVASALFTLVHIVRPNWLGVDFETLALAMLVLGVLFSPMAILSGLFAWWVTYSLRKTVYIVRKITFAVTLIAAEVSCLVIQLGGFADNPLARWVGVALIFWLAANVAILGYYGGQMVFPTTRSTRRSG